MPDVMQRQSLVQRSIDRALENFKKIGRSNLTAAKIRTRIAALKDNWQQFQDGHLALLKALPTEAKSSLDYFSSNQYDLTEETYQSTWAYMTELLEELEPVVSHTRPLEFPTRSDASALSLSHLPPIRIPPFDGSYEEWESFRDRFDALIIQNTDITDFARMHFLASALKGRALECISNLAITADNFQVAWKALKARFENKRRLLGLHLSTLLGLSAMTRESASELQILCDRVRIAVAALQTLNRTPEDLWNDFLVHVLSQKLDSATRKAWNLRTCEVENPPTYDEFNRFLSSRIRALEESAPNLGAKSSSKTGTTPRVHVATASTGSLSACPLCKSRHYLSSCPDFLAQTPLQRRDTVKRFKRCFNCLSASHSAQACKSQHSCRSCSKRHHSKLHMDAEEGGSQSAAASPSSSISTSNAPISEVHSMSAAARSSAVSLVLLATAWVQVRTESGRSVVARALLDQGSEATFISEALAQLLRVKRSRMPVTISAVGGVRVGTVRQAASILISPRAADDPSFAATALILHTLTSYAPRRYSDSKALAHLADLEWADADPTSSDPIQIIIGADLYSSLILDGLRKGKVGQPVAQNSVFGWVISGPFAPVAGPLRSPRRGSPIDSPSANLSAHHCACMQPLVEEIRRFWETEELPPFQTLTPSNEQCENHFCVTHSRAPDGRYIVRLPFKKDPPIDIGQSRSTAARIMNSLSRRFRAQSALTDEYRAFMREYETLGHMRRAPTYADSINPCVYIPHHPVLREGSVTTHLRVVFNASSLTSNGSSLNDHLLAGPKLQLDLTAIIMKWRQFRFVYTADIAKMYRQILVDERDIDYQRILWNGDDSDRLRDYQLVTVTYGMTCAPFLALRVIKCLADDEGHRFPLALPILSRQIYVDDVLFGDNDMTLARQSREQLISLLRCGKFELRKWTSNSPELLEDIDPSDHGLACSKQIASDEKVKVLGVMWSPACDVFKFTVTLTDPVPLSKRAILSTIAKLFDPLGWATPITIAAKILMQQLWRVRVEWDEVVPEPLLSRWTSIYSKLSFLNDLRLNRWTRDSAETSHRELHGFADASTLAYAAVVYLKVVSSSGEITISLLASKSRVAPIAPLTVPRLELSAALLLARLMLFVRRSLDFETVPCFCWTDSTIVLAWLRSHPSRWKIFIANRVNEIQSGLPTAKWRHVPTYDNPADCASRGLLGDDLINHRTWWQGPPWLRRPEADWPPESDLQLVNCEREEKVTGLHVCAPTTTWTLASRYSSWPFLIRVTAYLHRFVNGCRRLRDGSDSVPGRALSSKDCCFARTFWIKQIQDELFQDDIRLLTAGQNVSSKSPLAGLHPFLDRDRILRVGGRLRHAPFPYRVRHPILLAAHSLVKLIIRQAHLRVLHGGLQLTLNILRQDFWILRARHLVRRVIHQCIVCVRERSAIPEQIMGDLPKMRVSPPSRCFSHCGLDYAGPVRVRASAGRGIATRKAYIALFVCMTTRAIHLELVGDYSTSSFLNAYTRFCARRGLPHAMYSDNGTTFVGAEKEMALVYRSALRDPNFLNKTASDRVLWNFIPPSAPHFGGLWEAGVRSVKHHLRRVLGDHALTFEEFTTLLTKIEACLNSGPIAPLSDSLEDYDSLTPGHFLVGSALTVPPEPSMLNLAENRLSRWQVVRHITERFWRIWASDYVNTLQQRNKWRKVQPSVKIGQLVLLRNANLPPCKWELGRITCLHPGSDGLTRVITVKTSTSEYKRPLVKLCLLPVRSDAPSE